MHVSTPTILMTGRSLKIVETQLDENFDTHRLQMAADPEAFIDEIAEAVRGVVQVWHTRVDKAWIDRFPNLEIITNFGVGYDTVDAAYAGSKGIVVTNTPDVLSEEVADVAIGLLIMAARELTAAERYLRAGQWEKEGAYPLTHGSLRGRTVGIAGLGRIGKLVAERLKPFGVKLAYFGRTKQEDVDLPFYDNLVAMARDVDTLISILPGGQATRGIINAEVLKALGERGILVNIGRGSSVDERALIAALNDGTILNAGLDVYEKEPHVPPELIAIDKVALLPHVGSASIQTRDAMGQLMVDNLKSWFSTGKALTPVPETPNPKAG